MVVGGATAVILMLIDLTRENMELRDKIKKEKDLDAKEKLKAKIETNNIKVKKLKEEISKKEEIGKEKFKKLSPEEKQQIKDKADKLNKTIKSKLHESVTNEGVTTVGNVIATGGLLFLAAVGSLGVALKLKNMKRQNELLKIKIEKEKDDVVREKLKTQLDLQEGKYKLLLNEVNKKKTEGKEEYQKMTPEEKATIKQKAEAFGKKYEQQ